MTVGVSPKREAAMNTIERVIHFLRKHQDEVICDDCLAAELRVRSPLGGMLDVLSSDYVKRGDAECMRCGHTRRASVMFGDPKEGPAVTH